MEQSAAEENNRNDQNIDNILKSQQSEEKCHHQDQQSSGQNSFKDSDKKWTYVIILCSFLVTVLTLGFKTSLGVFYDEWEHYFNVTKTQVSWVTSLSPMVIGITSLFATGISHVFGPRLPVIFRGIIASAGIHASSYSQNIFHLMISLGIVSAVGMGFAFAPSIAILHHYFEKRFNVAIGIAIAGYSFGDLIFPLILQPMIHEYGWQGALFIISALELNLVACGCVMKLPDKNNQNLTNAVKKKPDDVYDINYEKSNTVYDFDQSDLGSNADIIRYLQIDESNSKNTVEVINESFVSNEQIEEDPATKTTEVKTNNTEILHNLHNEILFHRQASKLIQDFRQKSTACCVHCVLQSSSLCSS
ncbi:monocarboxylate transporter 9-like [Amphiura filiformis]|uniref:monocarboxylate transporter 9-like n=1 Tax=Amphiura filiformis TaxID=82378 RepID=UPI003B211BD9